MICPRCRVPMIVLEYEGVEIDHCLRCAGSWFDAGELALLCPELGRPGLGLRPEELAALPPAETKEESRRCPRCSKKMRKVLIGPARRILIDACPEGDGIWFDTDEVARLLQEVGGPDGAGLPERALAFLGRVFQSRPADRGQGGEA
jgi:Zn-finger nucleic acid-binding protein